MSKLQVFDFRSISIRVQSDENGNPLFCAKDVCDALGYINSRKAIADHCNQSGVTNRYISHESGRKKTTFVDEGNLYRLIIKSNKPQAAPFESFVCDEVLPSIRKTGGYTTNSTIQLPSIVEAISAAKIVAEMLHLSDSSVLMLAESVNHRYGSPMVLPGYAVDAPVQNGIVTTGSSMPTKSASELLREHGVKTSVILFNKKLEEQGFIKTLTRQATKGIKSYKCITEKGLEYGKNITSPSNNKETQPHWYVDLFSNLIDVVMS